MITTQKKTRRPTLGSYAGATARRIFKQKLMGDKQACEKMVRLLQRDKTRWLICISEEEHQKIWDDIWENRVSVPQSMKWDYKRRLREAADSCKEKVLAIMIFERVGERLEELCLRELCRFEL